MKNKRILSLGMAVTMLVSVLAVPVNVHADAIRNRKPYSRSLRKQHRKELSL